MKTLNLTTAQGNLKNQTMRHHFLPIRWQHYKVWLNQICSWLEQWEPLPCWWHGNARLSLWRKAQGVQTYDCVITSGIQLAHVSKEIGKGCSLHNCLHKPQLANNSNVHQWQTTKYLRWNHIEQRKWVYQSHSGNVARSQRQDEHTYAQSLFKCTKQYSLVCGYMHIW